MDPPPRPAVAMVTCRWCPGLRTRSSAYTLALGLGFVTLGTGRILLLKFSANAGDQQRVYEAGFLYPPLAARDIG